jgi:hypothetical protein
MSFLIPTTDHADHIRRVAPAPGAGLNGCRGFLVPICTVSAVTETLDRRGVADGADSTSTFRRALRLPRAGERTGVVGRTGIAHRIRVAANRNGSPRARGDRRVGGAGSAGRAANRGRPTAANNPSRAGSAPAHTGNDSAAIDHSAGDSVGHATNIRSRCAHGAGDHPAGSAPSDRVRGNNNAWPRPCDADGIHRHLGPFAVGGANV